MRIIGEVVLKDRPASTNTMSRFETEVLTQDGNVEGLGPAHRRPSPSFTLASRRMSPGRPSM